MEVKDIFSHWNQVRADLFATIDKFDDGELKYQPYPGSWSVGEILLHIAGAEEGWFQYVVRKKYDQWLDDYKLEDYPSKQSIKRKLMGVHDQTIEYLSGLKLADLEMNIDFPWDGKNNLAWIIWHVLEHEIHHRGELSLILGILGREGLDV